jgi:hypothetical protein
MSVCSNTTYMEDTPETHRGECTELYKVLLMGFDSTESESDPESESESESGGDEDDVNDPGETLYQTVGDFARGSVMYFMASQVKAMRARFIALNRVVSMQLRQPSPDAICPISMDDISTSTVSGFEGFLLDEERPTFTEAVLPCGHSFSTCYLVVAWLTSPMRCPLCRGGIDLVLDIDSIPMKWQAVSKAHVERLRLQDLEQQMAYARQVQAEEIRQNVFALHVHMCVYFTSHSGSVYSMVVNFLSSEPSTTHDRNGMLHLHVPRAQIRALSRTAIRHNATTMNCVVFARRVDEGGVDVQLGEVAQSGPVPIPVHEPCMSPMTTQPGVPVRDVVIVQQAEIRRHTEPGITEEGVHNVTFGTHWQVYPNRTLNTLLDITVSVKLSDLAAFIGDMISEI